MDTDNVNINSLLNNIERPKKTLKDYFVTRETDGKLKMVCKETQVNIEAIIMGDKSKGFSWEAAAEKNRIALSEALSENKKLWTLYESLTKEISFNKQQLDEANDCIKVLKELMEDTPQTEVGDASIY